MKYSKNDNIFKMNSFIINKNDNFLFNDKTKKIITIIFLNIFERILVNINVNNIFK